MIGTPSDAGPGLQAPCLDPPIVSKPRTSTAPWGVAKESLDLFLIHFHRFLASVKEFSSCGELYGNSF